MESNTLPTAEELFGKHFNGLHYDDITPEGIQKYAHEYAVLFAKHHRDIDRIEFEKEKVEYAYILLADSFMILKRGWNNIFPPLENNGTLDEYKDALGKFMESFEEVKSLMNNVEQQRIKIGAFKIYPGDKVNN